MPNSSFPNTSSADGGPPPVALQSRPVIEFWFREIDAQGLEIGLERFKGVHDGDRLLLGMVEIPDSNILDLIRSGDNLWLSWFDADQGEPISATIRVYNRGFQFKSAIDYGLSRRRYRAGLDQAAAAHRGDECRDTVCPHCQSMVVTMEIGEWAPQVYCQYCDSLITTIELDDVSPQELNRFERNYRICESCNMYSRPRQFSVAYFYFLIFHAGVHHNIRHCCPACMRSDAWMMLFGNLPFILGVPFAITQLFRVYGDSIRKGPFRGLDEANALLKRGKIERALEKYSTIIQRHPVSAGVLYNIALGLVAQKRTESARETLQLAIENCANYTPALLKLGELDDAKKSFE